MDREEGEISDPNDSIDYVPVHRPVSQYRNIAQHLPSSDEDDDSGSDSDSPCMPKKKRIAKKMDMDTDVAQDTWTTNPLNEMNGNGMQRKPKRNNIWANVLGEQCLTEEINIVGLKKLEGDRNVENYDFKTAQALMNENAAENSPENITDEPENDEEEEGEIDREQRIQDRLGRKRQRQQKNKEKERNLINIDIDPEWTDEELGKKIADALFESRPEIIVRVVQVLGRENALKLYTQTKDIESEGGMMTLNGHRRRTSGGVFLQLLKQFPDITPEQTQLIFPPNDKSNQQWSKRKRAQRRRVRHDSKPQGNNEAPANSNADDQLSDSASGVKCPGSTPVTSPQQSDNDDASPINPPMVESDQLEASVMAAKLDAKLNEVCRTEEPKTYNDDLFEFNAPTTDEMELF